MRRRRALACALLQCVGCASRVATTRDDASSARAAAMAAVPPDCLPEPMPPMPRDHVMPKVIQERPLTVDECVQLEAQVAAARATALRYPYRYLAIAAHYALMTAYEAGQGSHFQDPHGVPTRFDPARPTYLLYDGDGPFSQLVGVAHAMHSRAEPEFFVGPNDVPHQHVWCAAAPGSSQTRIPGDPGCTDRNANGVGNWFLHVWLVPDKDCPVGLFSTENPNLTAHGWDPAHPLFTVSGAAAGLHHHGG